MRGVAEEVAVIMVEEVLKKEEEEAMIGVQGEQTKGVEVMWWSEEALWMVAGRPAHHRHHHLKGVADRLALRHRRRRQEEAGH